MADHVVGIRRAVRDARGNGGWVGTCSSCNWESAYAGMKDRAQLEANQHRQAEAYKAQQEAQRGESR